MKRVQILSPFRGESSAIERRHVEYAKAAMRDCFARGEAPWAPHLLYPQVMSDLNESERQVSIEAGCNWLARADLVAAYIDLGISAGMRLELEQARRCGVQVVERRLSGWHEPPAPRTTAQRIQDLRRAGARVDVCIPLAAAVVDGEAEADIAEGLEMISPEFYAELWPDMPRAVIDDLCDGNLAELERWIEEEQLYGFLVAISTQVVKDGCRTWADVRTALFYANTFDECLEQGVAWVRGVSR